MSARSPLRLRETHRRSPGPPTLTAFVAIEIPPMLQDEAVPGWTEDLIGGRFERMARRFEQKPASRDIDRNYTYRELNESANRLAHRLLDARGYAEEPVALLLEHSTAMVVGFLGSVKAGKIAMPIDTAWPVARLAAMVADANCALIVTNRRNEPLAGKLAGPSQQIVVLETLTGPEGHGDPPQSFTPDRLAYLLYTSGSTGKPKGIVHSHRTALHNIGIYTKQLGITSDDRLTWLHSPGFSSAWAEILTALLNGASICPWDIPTRGLSGLGDWHNRQQVTVLNWAPSPFRRFMETLRDSSPLLTPRLLVLGSEPVTKRDWELFRERFPDDCRFVNRLGATEVNNYRMCILDKSHEPTGAVIPAGYAVPGKEVLLADESGQPTEAGTVGQIFIRSRYCSPGYWNNPELTRRTFLPDPTDSTARLFRTGDLGLLRDDGCLEYHGRGDHQVKVRGVRVEVGEIENALTHHPAICEAAVVARPGVDGETHLIAYLVPRQSRPESRDLRAHLLPLLPAAMLPEAFVFVDALPTTDTGKVDRAALPAIPEGVTVAGDRCEPAREPVAPRNRTEERLAAIWCDVLSLERVGIQESFFDRGGNSLRALTLFARIDAEFDRRLPVTSLLEHSTIAELASLLDGTRDGQTDAAIVAIRGEGARPPLFVIHSVTGGLLFWRRFLPYLSGDQPVFGLHPPEIAGIVQPFSGIESLASRFANELCAHQPQGAFRIAGYSFGGPLAFELARQLHERGRSIALLAIIDAHARLEKPDWQARLRLIPPLVANACYWITDDLFRSGWRSVARRCLKVVRQWFRGVRGTTADELREIERLPEPLRKVRASAQNAMSAYRCRPFPGAVTLLRNRLQLWCRLQRFDYRWGEVADRVDVRIVTFCRHYQMVKEPHVRLVASALQQALDNTIGSG